MGRAPARADLRAGERVQRLVLSGRVPPCGRHDLAVEGWARLADEAMLILGDPGVWSEDLVRNLVHARHGPEHASPFARVLLGLFSESIAWGGKAPRVDNGQHRLCGARVAGVSEIMIGWGEAAQRAPGRSGGLPERE